MAPKASFPAAHPSVLPSSPEAMRVLGEFSSPSVTVRPPGAGKKPSPPSEDFGGQEFKKERTEATMYPPRTVLVLSTMTNGIREYRVGVVLRKDFVEGLRRSDGTLNPAVAHRCFGKSELYGEREAEEAAHALYARLYDHFIWGAVKDHLTPRSREEEDRISHQAAGEAAKQVCGIKIIHLPYPWPDQ